jgi:hypothetical protein
MKARRPSGLRMHRIRTGGKKIKGAPFMGEMMTCAVCGKQQKSDPKIESQWTCVVLGDRRVYFCPKCFGNDGDLA